MSDADQIKPVDTKETPGLPEKGKTKSNDAKFDQFYLHSLFDNPLEYLKSQPPSLTALFESDCLIAFDANVLMSLYALDNTSIADVEKVLKRLTEARRLFIPERAFLEYLKNRQVKVGDAYDLADNAKSHLGSVKAFPFPMLEGKDEFKELQVASEEMRKATVRYKKAIDGIQGVLTNWGWNDPVSQMLIRILKEEHIIKCKKPNGILSEETKQRYEQRIPPGYKDRGKPDDGIGDAIIWQTILEVGKESKRNIVFVTNDGKSDWMMKTNLGTAIMPRSELIGEFFSESKCHFNIADMARFLELMKADDSTVVAVAQAEAQAEAVAEGRTRTTITVPILNYTRPIHYMEVLAEYAFKYVISDEVHVFAEQIGGRTFVEYADALSKWFDLNIGVPLTPDDELLKQIVSVANAMSSRIGFLFGEGNTKSRAVRYNSSQLKTYSTVFEQYVDDFRNAIEQP